MKIRLSSIVASAILLCTAVSFGAQTVGLQIHDRTQTVGSEGYNLFTSRKYNTTYLIDMEGRKVKSWTYGTDNGEFQRVEHAKIVELDGTSYLMRTCRLPYGDPRDDLFSSTPGHHGRIELVDWNDNVVWYYEHASDSSILHHDAIGLPNGNIVMSVWDVYSEAEMIANGKTGSDGTPHFFSERLIEVTPNFASGSGGTIVWQWEVMDHLGDDDPSKVGINTSRKASHSDWIHISGIAYNPEKDWIIGSFHSQSELMIIDHNTTTSEAAGTAGDIIYRWGNPVNYGGTGIRQLYALHHPHWIPEGMPNAGNILVINNGNSKIPSHNFSHVDMIDPGNYETHDYSDPVWYYEEKDPLFFTQNLGSAQMLPNGNMLIDEGVFGRFFEINSSKDIVWQYTNPVIELEGALDQGDIIPATSGGDLYNEAFRCIRYFADNPFFEGKNLASGDPIEGYSSITRDTISAGQSYNWEGTDYTETGIYIVESNGWHYLDLLVQEATSISDIQHFSTIGSISKSGSKVTLTLTAPQRGILKIYSATGREIFNQSRQFSKGTTNITLSDMAKGVYLIEFISGNTTLNSKITLLK